MSDHAAEANLRAEKTRGVIAAQNGRSISAELREVVGDFLAQKEEERPAHALIPSSTRVGRGSGLTCKA